jgi:hypothetical protein
MNAWVDVHGTQAERKTLMESLPSLPVGDAWVWSPGWSTDGGIFERIRTLPIETFDSGATPKPGERRVEPKHLAEVDLEAVRAQMAATIERAKLDDPKALRKRIAELEALAKQLERRSAQAVACKRAHMTLPMLSTSAVQQFALQIQELGQRTNSAVVGCSTR